MLLYYLEKVTIWDSIPRIESRAVFGHSKPEMSLTKAIQSTPMDSVSEIRNKPKKGLIRLKIQ